VAGSHDYSNEPVGSIKYREFELRNYQLLKKNSAPWSSLVSAE